MFVAIFLFHVFCLAIYASFVASTLSKSAFGETVRENTKATGVELIRDTFYAASLVACNLRCLDDKECGATNYIANGSLSNGASGGVCQLLSRDHGNGVIFVQENGAVYTRLLKDEDRGNEAVQEACDDGFSFDSKTSTCFIVPAQAASWAGSQTKCSEMGGTLAKVDSSTKLNFIRSITKNALYIGLKQERNGSLIWSDGSVVQQSNFLSESISRSFCNANQACCSLLEYRSQFRYLTLKEFSQFCRTPGYFICEKKSRR